MRIFRSAGFIVTLAFLWAGCGMDKNIKDCVTEGAAAGQLSVHVSCGDSQARPIYTWSDINNIITATDVEVARTSSPNTAVWKVHSTLAQDDIQSPVTQGTVPLNAGPVTQTEIDLQTNISYRVTVTKVDGTFGYREFTIQP